MLKNDVLAFSQGDYRMNTTYLHKSNYRFFTLMSSVIFISNSLGAAWSSPAPISQALKDSRFNIQASAATETVAVWLTYDSIGGIDALYSTTATSGVWSVASPTLISLTTDRTFDPILVTDSNNDFVFIWGSIGPLNTRILAVRKPQAGVWSLPVVVYSAGSNKIEFGSLAASTDSVGDTILTWTIFDGTNFKVMSSVYSP